jgi:predicted ATPase/DNA-binding transcriptional LysR family regulator
MHGCRGAVAGVCGSGARGVLLPRRGTALRQSAGHLEAHRLAGGRGRETARPARPRGGDAHAAGQVLADYVLRAEALLANGRRALAAGADAQIGTLSLAASGIPGTYLLPELLSRFQDGHPDVEIDLRVSTSAGALDLVRAHEVELAVVGGMTVPPELESEPLVDDDIVLVGPPSLGTRRLRVKDLEGFTWISREEGSATRAAVEAARWQAGLHPVRTLELSSWEAVKLAVGQGPGIAAISRLALDVELRAGTLAALDVPRWRLTRTISLVTARGVPLTPPAERFVGLLRAQFRAEDELPPNSNLPSQAALVGRQKDVAAIAEALRASRLVTLTGPGGGGKTSLAVAAAAREVDRFRDGIFFVKLAPLREARRVLETIADTLGASDRSSLSERLRGSSTLLVLDNFEQVVDAAPDVARLVEKAPLVHVIVTSRVPLRVRGELVIEVTPLLRDDAMALFVQAGQQFRPGLEADDVVARICERLDGLPLAVELAAARSNVLAPPQLLARLEEGLEVLSSASRDVEPRHRTLRATIAWSCDLLSHDARALFARLSVFAGGWSLDAAERICQGTIDTLAELVEQNLVRRDDERFAMLDTIHDYAAEMLKTGGEAGEVQRRHAEYFAALSEEADPHLTGRDQAAWLARMRQESENVRAAVAWANASGERELQLRIAGASWKLWIGQSGREEWRAWLEEALAEVEDPRLRLLALAPLSWLAFGAMDDERAAPIAEERIRLGRLVGSDEHLAGGYSILSALASRRGDFARALELGEKVVDIDRKGGDENRLAAHLANFAGVHLDAGDFRAARQLFEESRTIFLKCGNEVLAASVLLSIASIELREGDGAKELALALEGLPTVLAGGDPETIWYSLELTGAASVALGRHVEGIKLLAAAEELRRSAHNERPPGQAELRDSALSLAIEVLGEKKVAQETSRGAALGRDEAIQLALTAANPASGS